jgi:carbonic anhydrase/acetyltransferase-like protein (isoleucine patch superfamily)
MGLVKRYKDVAPTLGAGVWLAETAAVIGDVVLGEDTNVWYGTVIRGDVGAVRIGCRVNLQDLCCVHMTENVSSSIIDDDVSLGHGVIVHGARIERGALIGMGSILMDNAVVGEQAIVGAGSLVTAGTVLPPRVLALGRPARVVRPLRDDELEAGLKTARKYVRLARDQNGTVILPE